MRTLSKIEVTQFMQNGRALSEQQGSAILDQFERNQPQMYQAIFGEFSDGISEENLEMSHLFLDLCFDIIVVYQMAFGDPPINVRGDNWLMDKVTLLDAELKSLTDEDVINSQFKQRLRDRFVDRSLEAGLQIELLQHLDEQVRNYVNFKPVRQNAMSTCSNLLFVVVRLMDDIYNAA
jgi:hypothetical protein